MRFDRNVLVYSYDGLEILAKDSQKTTETTATTDDDDANGGGDGLGSPLHQQRRGKGQCCCKD